MTTEEKRRRDLARRMLRSAKWTMRTIALFTGLSISQVSYIAHKNHISLRRYRSGLTTDALYELNRIIRQAHLVTDQIEKLIKFRWRTVKREEKSAA